MLQLLRYGELFLKGKNRSFFEKKLIDNVKKIVKVDNVKRLQGRLVVTLEDATLLKRVFGLVSYSSCEKVGKDLETIKKAALEVMKTKRGTFKVETKRSDKTFSVKSPDMNHLVGSFIEENSDLKFSFDKPDTVLGIEINQDGTYLFTETVKCFGGLPTGVEGSVYVSLETDADVLAGLLFMKRGTSIIPLGDYGLPLLQKFSPTELNVAKVDSKHALVVGQNFENYQERDGIVFRPLIAYDDTQIKKELHYFEI
jgi:tRNA uracil 4-sulfurtransferase